MKFGFTVASILLASSCGIHTSKKTEMAPVSAWVYALKYGESEYPAKLVNTPAKTQTVHLNWLAYLIVKNSHELTLVDCGFSEPKLLRRFQIRNFRPVRSLITDLGFKIENVKRVFLTHTHFDHALDVHDFPKAIVFVHRAEFNNPQEPTLRKNFDDLQQRNQIKIVDGPLDIEPGVQIVPIQGHTPGSIVIRYQKESRTAYFTGDECYFSSSCYAKISLPSGAASAPENNQAFIISLDKSATLFTGHETNFTNGVWINNYVFFFDGSI